MKKNIILLFALALSVALHAQDFVGNMSIASFQQKNITCRLSATPQGKATLVMQHVKFARMMPVRVDMELEDLSVRKEADGSLTLTGNNIVPTAGGKSYPKKVVTNFQGRVRGGVLTIQYTMSEKQTTYSGRLKK